MRRPSRVHDCSQKYPGAIRHVVRVDHSLRAAVGRIRRLYRQQHHVGGCRLPADAGDLGRGRRRRAGLPAPAIRDHRGRRNRRVHRARLPALLDGGDRLRHRRDPVRRGRLYRHERVGSRQRPHRAGGDGVAGGRPRHRLPLGRGHRHAGRGPRAPRRRRLFRLPDRRPRLRAVGPHCRRRAGRAWLRRFADLDFRPVGRRHLHQRRGRRRRPRGQG